MDSNLLNIGKISFKSTDAVIYNIRYMTMENLDYVNIDSENPYYLIFNNVDGYMKESNGDKYLIFASADKNNEALIKYAELWDKIKNQMEAVNGCEPIKCKKDFMKIRFESDDDLPLGQILSIPVIIIVIEFVLQEDDKYYPQVCVHEYVYKSVNGL